MPSHTKNNTEEVGRVVSFFSGVAKVLGLPNVFLHEVLIDEDGAPAAIVIGFDERVVEVLFFDETFDFKKRIFRSGKPFSVPVSERCVGRIIGSVGNPKDGLGAIEGEQQPLFRGAPPIIDRQPVSVPLSTGIKIVDTNLPLGRGQRELIIGDRKLGKSTLAMDTVLHQKHADPPVSCVYVLCGQEEQELRECISLFKKNNAFLYTTIVVAAAKDSFAEQYLAPFTGCAIGEYFRDHGKDALVIYDDLSKHAKTYRSISLLLERAPGREAYPGDIFSLHAGLLERSAQLSKEKGGGTLTALPIVETQEGDITSFIPTNLISITDGQVYVESGLFQKGFIPAVNVGLSVSRVGSQAQPKPLTDVVGGIRLALSQHKELQKLSQLETVMSVESQKKVHRGDLTLELLKQQKHVNINWMEQVVLFYALNEGFLDDMKKEQIAAFEMFLLNIVKNRYPEILIAIQKNEMDDALKEKIKSIVNEAKQEGAL